MAGGHFLTRPVKLSSPHEIGLHVCLEVYLVIFPHLIQVRLAFGGQQRHKRLLEAEIFLIFVHDVLDRMCVKSEKEKI